MGFYVMLLIYAAPWLLLIGGSLYLGARCIRLLERRRETDHSLTSSNSRLTALEEAVAQLSREMNQLSDGQRFTSDLLSARAGVASETPEQR